MCLSGITALYCIEGKLWITTPWHAYPKTKVANGSFHISVLAGFLNKLLAQYKYISPTPLSYVLSFTAVSRVHLTLHFFFWAKQHLTGPCFLLSFLHLQAAWAAAELFIHFQWGPGTVEQFHCAFTELLVTAEPNLIIMSIFIIYSRFHRAQSLSAQEANSEAYPSIQLSLFLCHPFVRFI